MRVELKGVSHTYRSQTRPEVAALRDVSLALEPMEVTLVLGANGAGKSTLLECLAGLLEIDAGAVRYESTGSDAAGWRAGQPAPASYRRMVGMLFQYPERQLFGLNGLDDVVWGLDGTVDARRALETVELSGDVVERPLHMLSRGELRRISLAGMMVRDPRLILLDEPSIGLDVAGRDLLWRIVDEYRFAVGAPVVVASHWAADHLGRADNVVCLDAGRVVFSGSPKELLEAASDLTAVFPLLPAETRLAQKLGSIPPSKRDGWQEIALRLLD